MYMCMDMIVYAHTYAHIMRLCVLYDYVQRYEDTIGVEQRYIYQILVVVVAVVVAAAAAAAVVVVSSNHYYYY